MSTLTSADINLSRSSTRLHAPPGGASSFSFGGNSPVKVAPPVAAPVPVAASSAPKAAEAALSASVNIEEVELQSKSTCGKVGVAIGGTFANDLLQDAILLALTEVGIVDIVVRVSKDATALPYVAKSLTKVCDVVFAGAVLNGDKPESGALRDTLTQALLDVGVKGDIPVISGITTESSVLEAKVVLPEFAETWAESVSTVLQLAVDPDSCNVEVVLPVVKKPAEKAVLNKDVVDVAALMNFFRQSLREHGATGIFSLGRKFRIVDDNGNGVIDLSEFKKCIAEHSLGWTAAQIKVVFDYFDKDKSGGISFDEFLRGCRAPMNDRRRQLVLLAFEVLDADKSGTIELNDIQAHYSADKHPDVIANKRTKDEILREFLDTFDGDVKDGKVHPSEFCEYYENVSSSIDDDDYFELMIRNAWHISGGSGWCANSSCRRVLVTHTDGHQSVEEIRNDLGIGPTDKDKMIANLVKQGISTVASIDISGSTEASSSSDSPPVVSTPVKAPVALCAGTPTVTDPSVPHAVANRNGRFGRGCGQTLSSSITF